MTPERLRELLHYDLETGAFVWLVNTKRACAGSVAGCQNRHGYLRICIDGRSYQAHRLAWLYVYGAWPTDQIDHRNGVCDDNRLCNLREATAAENMQNRRLNKDNTSGFMGVSWDKTNKTWLARIRINSKKLDLGRFSTPEAAHEAYVAAKARLHTFQPVMRVGPS